MYQPSSVLFISCPHTNITSATISFSCEGVGPYGIKVSLTDRHVNKVHSIRLDVFIVLLV